MRNMHVLEDDTQYGYNYEANSMRFVIKGVSINPYSVTIDYTIISYPICNDYLYKVWFKYVYNTMFKNIETHDEIKNGRKGKNMKKYVFICKIRTCYKKTLTLHHGKIFKVQKYTGNGVK